MKTKRRSRPTPEIFEKTLRTNTLGPWLVAQAFVPLLEEKRRAANRERFQQRRPTRGWRRWLGAGLLRLEDGAERRHRSAGRGAAEVCGQLRLSRLGAHRHGRRKRPALHRGRRIRSRLARGRAPTTNSPANSSKSARSSRGKRARRHRPDPAAPDRAARLSLPSFSPSLRRASW